MNTYETLHDEALLSLKSEMEALDVLIHDRQAQLRRRADSGLKRLLGGAAKNASDEFCHYWRTWGSRLT